LTKHTRDSQSAAACVPPAIFLNQNPQFRISENKAVFFPRGVILGAFAKSRKSAVSFVTPVCLFLRMEQLGSHRMDFHRI
jgi:hypothetical protein